MQLLRDIEEAAEMYQAGCNLPSRLWAAHMAAMTGMHTYEVFYTVKGDVGGFGTTLQFECQYENGEYAGLKKIGELLNYLPPSQIARRIRKLIGTPRELMSSDELGQAIILLEDDTDRMCALEAINALDIYHDGPGVPPAAERSKRIKALAGKHAVSEPPRSNGKSEQPALPILTLSTEPPEVFAAELERLKEGTNRRGGLVDAFCGSEGGTQ